MFFISQSFISDIAKGEELTYDYYMYDTDWELFGL